MSPDVTTLVSTVGVVGFLLLVLWMQYSKQKKNSPSPSPTWFLIGLKFVAVYMIAFAAVMAIVVFTFFLPLLLLVLLPGLFVCGEQEMAISTSCVMASGGINIVFWFLIGAFIGLQKARGKV